MDDDKHSQYIEIASDVPEMEPELLWYSGWYDGPTTGMVRVDGELAWAQMAAECWHPEGVCTWYRKYLVMRLDPAELAEELARHAAFEEHVSGPSAMGWKHSPAAHQRPQSEWDKFYDAYPSKTEPVTGEVIGWFAR